MKTIINQSTDPYFNLALEEYLLKEYPLTEDLFYIWRNTSSVVVGRNQNVFNEVDLMYCYKNQIPVMRRISGGGTVYHDLGNVNFTYITNKIDKLNNYHYFLQPIITLLNQMGLQTEFKPKSHIFLNEYKVSGNAQAFYKERMLHHGTLLYDINTDDAKNALRRKNIEGHHILSVPAEIINLKDKTPVLSDIDMFMNYLLDGVVMGVQEENILHLTEVDLQKINALRESKYLTYDWTYGINTPFRLKNDYIDLSISKGIITTSNYKALIGKKLEIEIIQKVLKDLENQAEIIKSIF